MMRALAFIPLLLLLHVKDFPFFYWVFQPYPSKQEEFANISHYLFSSQKKKNIFFWFGCLVFLLFDYKRYPLGQVEFSGSCVTLWKSGLLEFEQKF